MHDIVIRGGSVVDGRVSAPRVADVAVDGGVVSRIAPSITDPAAQELDAAGKVVSPGFVDAHSHDDLALLREPAHPPKLFQGVTSVVTGNCGHGCAPWTDLADMLVDYSAPVLGPFPAARGWDTTAEYVQEVARQPRGVNSVTLVPHGALRASALAFSNRAATAAEVDWMSGVLDDALSAGAAGLSLGLMYPPGCYASREELVSLARVVAGHGRVLVCHLRSEGAHLVPSLDEFVGIGRDAGAAMHVSHLKVVGPDNHGSMEAVVDRLDRMRADGCDVTADVYPYTAGSTTVATMFPPSCLDGGVDGLLQRLGDPAECERIRAELCAPWDGMENCFMSLGPERIRLSGFAQEANVPHDGRSLADIAAARRQDPLDCLVQVVREEDARLSVIQFQMCEGDVRTALQWPWSMIGSDGLPLATGALHPRHYGTFPRVLAHYVRQEGVLTLQDAIRKMTSLPAQRFGMSGRGELAEGEAADLCVFAPDTLQDHATYADPRRHPTGIDMVLVNGRVAARGGEVEALAGTALPAG
jgi:N-acyl-D-aspartate/D-glutamate deacylase